MSPMPSVSGSGKMNESCAIDLLRSADILKEMHSFSGDDNCRYFRSMYFVECDSTIVRLQRLFTPDGKTIWTLFNDANG